MFNPYVILGALVGVILLAGASFGAGWKASSNSWKADMLKAEQAHTRAMLRELEKSNAAAADLEKARAARRVVYKTVTKEVERLVADPAYVGQCFDESGVRAVNSAITGEAVHRSQPDPAVPAPRSLGKRN